MLEMKTLDSYNQKRYTCPGCGQEVTFYVFSAVRQCFGCHTLAPNFEKLLHSHNYRTYFHLCLAERQLPDANPGVYDYV